MASPLYLRDRNLLRRLTHAHRHTASLQDRVPEAAAYLSHLSASADTLRHAAHAHHIEQLDDPPAARHRDGAEASLRAGAIGLLERARVEVYLSATDTLGRVTDAPLMARFHDFQDGFVSGALGGNLPQSGPALVEHARALHTGLVKLLGADHSIGAHLAQLLANTEEAREAVEVEATELRATRAALEAAREDARRAVVIARHTVGLMNALYPEHALDPRTVFPPTRSTAAADAASLDAADVAELP